tara:strand:- start:477 stop:1142 length:666 start_codon:yes stop_codon:yes gene_type:complete
MSKTITHEGKEYILKSEVDNIVTSRISKISENRRTTQTELDSLREKYAAMESQIKGVEALHSQIATLQDELSSSNKKYSRHSAIASHGITNPKVRDLVEWEYKNAMDARNKKDRETMGEWLESFKGENAEIPLLLQPYIKNGDSQASPTPQAKPMPAPTTQEQLKSLNARPVPQTNAHVQTTSDTASSADIMNKGAFDFDYYQKNRARIKEIYYKRKGKRI